MHFVDTNLLVYARDDADPAKRDRAREVMRLLWHSGRGRLSYQVLNEFYNTVTRKLSPGLPRDEAIADVRSFTSWQPLAPNPELFDRAWWIEERHRLSWWDSMIVAAALVQNCQTLLTEDLQDGQQIEGLQVISPFAFQFDLSRLA